MILFIFIINFHQQINLYSSGRSVFPGLFGNIQKLADKSSDTVPICMKKAMDKAIANFAAIQKSIPAKAPAPAQNPNPASTTIVQNNPVITPINTGLLAPQSSPILGTPSLTPALNPTLTPTLTPALNPALNPAPQTLTPPGTPIAIQGNPLNLPASPIIT